MEFLKIVALHGPNRWAGVPVLEVAVELSAWRGEQADRSRQLRSRFELFLPVLSGDATPAANVVQARAMAAARGYAAALDAELRSGGRAATVLERVTRCLQALAGVVADYGESHETDDPAVELITIQFEEESLARAWLETARQLCRAVAAGEPFDLPAEVRKLVDLADDVRLGPSSRAIVQAAAARGISYRRLTSGSLVQLGEGKHQRRIWTAESDATSAIGEQIASDKDLTKRLLRAVGVPVPGGRPVLSAEDAWDAAREVGLPVAVKPRDANHGRGISLDLTTREQVLIAYQSALSESVSGVLVERFALGQQHRLLVVGRRFIAATRGEHEYITGDGRQTISELVQEVNRDPRRGENYTDVLDVLNLNKNAWLLLKQQNLTPESVLAAGRRVLVQYHGDLTTDETAEVHPRNAAHAVLAAQVVGLDIAGLDVIAEDIGRPLEEQGGVIVEVNAGPSIKMHVEPLYGEPQPVGEAIVDMLFGPGETGRVPIIAVTGRGDRAAVTENLGALLRAAGWKVGVGNSAGVFFDDRRIGSEVISDRENIQTLLLHPFVTAAVIESRPEQANADGLGCSRVDVAVLVGGEEGGGGVSGPNLVDDSGLFGGERAVLNAVPASGFVVRPAADAAGDTWSGACRGTIVTYSVSGNQIVVQLGARTMEIEMPRSIAGLAQRQVSFCAAIAAVVALGWTSEQIRAAVAGVF